MLVYVFCRELFTQGRRRYFVDLRQNQRGRFLKVTMVTGRKTFVAIPGDSITQFRDALVSLLESHATEGEESGGGNEQRRPPLEPKSPAQSNSDILPSKEVRAGGKRFFFDVGQNDRGTFIKLSEVSHIGWWGFKGDVGGAHCVLYLNLICASLLTIFGRREFRNSLGK